MELLYTPLLNIPEPGRQIRALIGSAAVADAVTRAVSGEYLRDPSLGSDEYGGNVLLVRDIVARYIDRCILPYDAAHPGFRIEGLEQSVTAPVFFCLGSETHTVTFAGTSDRLDRLTDGRVRVVDYKTGAPKTEFRDLDALFSADSRQRNAAALQTLLYSMMVSRPTGSDVQPALYYVRRMNDPDYSPLLVEGKREVFSFAPYRDPFAGVFADDARFAVRFLGTVPPVRRSLGLRILRFPRNLPEIAFKYTGFPYWYLILFVFKLADL